MATARQRRTRTRTNRNPRRRRSASARRAPSRAQARRPDALRMLKEDHQKVKEMFDRFERVQSSVKEQLARTICEELELHTKLEEEIFYPAVREAIVDDDLMEEAEVEHESAKQLIAQIKRSSSSDERFDALVKVLGEYVKHHIREEEGEMFRKVRRSRLDTAELGEQMKERKADLGGGSESGEERGRRGIGSRLFGASA